MRCRHLGVVDYQSTFDAMKAFTASRAPGTQDEIWLLQHPPVYTQGLSGKPEHILNTGDVPVIQVDRGGQVTYHGPGQWVAYVLYDLRRANVNIRELVNLLETAVVQVLAESGIAACGDPAARGVYVEGRKIAALGLKCVELEPLWDLDTEADLARFERLFPALAL